MAIENMDYPNLDMSRIPNHIAIIMDGNGRWAKEQGQDRVFGHTQGVEAVRGILKESVRLGVKMLTLYTFSEENWQRPKEEVFALMSLLTNVVDDELPELMEEGVKLKAIGELSALPEEPRKALQMAIDKTSMNNRITVVLAINYSGRSEILAAANRLRNSTEPISEEAFKDALYLNVPDPDLLIRTGGELRISNFLLWQIAYTELYFTPVYWPAFDEAELRKAIEDYQKRQRRFGMTGDQVDALNNNPREQGGN